MMSYFKPFRRKLGLITLATACVFLAGWVRSYSANDVVRLPGELRFGVVSYGGQIAWGRKAMFEWGGLGASSNGPLAHWTIFWRTPYWSIVIPLTLLSAWLLLGKPQKPRSGPTPI